MIGRVDRLNFKPAVDHWKARGLDYSAILYSAPSNGPRRQTFAQDHGLADALDNELIARCHEALEHTTPVSISLPIRNVNRTVGTMLGYEVTKRYGAEGLPDDTIRLSFTGSAGQSFGAFVPRGITLTLEGDSNDYIGKGLSGGKLIVYPPKNARFVAEDNILIGNVALYGATSGEAYFRGVAGERFAVRNSGALAVVEGVGDHGCEYMTGGRVVVLGRTGRNFAAGMSGGIAYVLDPNDDVPAALQHGDGGSRVARRSGGRAARAKPDRAARAVHGQRARIARARELRGAAVAVREGDAARLQARAAGAGARRRGGARSHVPRAGRSGVQWVRSPDSSKFSARNIRRGRSASACTTGSEVYLPYPEDGLRDQAARCMDCGIPFCHSGCPLGNLIPDWNDLVYRDRWKAAIDRLHATNNFPEFTGRLCPAPCEGACVLGINNDPVTIKAVEVSIIDRAFDEGWVTAQPPETRTGRRVAVVGSGPAGLAAAAQLNRAGHTVTVFERADRIGGLLRYGIPEFKLEKRHLDRRLNLLMEEGITFRTNANIGVDIPIGELKVEFDAIVLAGGSTRPRDLPVPGRELAGIHFAMDYLTLQNRGTKARRFADDQFISAKDKHVIIIGGGDTGADCLGTAHRQGAASVHQLELLAQPPDSRAPGNPWPLWPNIFRVSSAHEEGGERMYSIATQKFTGDEQGRVTTLHAHRVEMVNNGGRDGVQAGAEQRVRAEGRSRAAGDGIPRTRDQRHADEARREDDRPRQRLARRALDDERARRVRRRRHAARSVAHRLGDCRRTLRRARRRRIPDGPNEPARTARVGRPYTRTRNHESTASRGRPSGTSCRTV